MIAAWDHYYWAWAGGNVGAIPPGLYDVLWGATWGNNTAAAEWAIAAAAAAYLGRDRLGRMLARWWQRYHGEHLRAELAAMEERLRAHITAQASGSQQEDR